MNKKTIFYVGLYAVAAYGAYYLYNNTKKAYARIILDKGMAGGGQAKLLAFDKGYLKAWAMSAKANQATFLYEGKTYNTKGGMLPK